MSPDSFKNVEVKEENGDGGEKACANEPGPVNVKPDSKSEMYR